ncbi:MAG: HAMP domain-containing histidine kinase [Bryobacterales bacterium]|nr:HAMP domain-containing histidine kinase [Bryobacterales bacterium]
MIAQYLESLGVSRRTSRTGVLLLSVALLAVVMALEWVQKLEYSLGIFYALPLAVAATVLNRWYTVLAAVFCAFARGLFTLGLTPIEFWLRFAMALLAYGGVGLLVSEMSRNRRAILAAYARLKMEEDLRKRAEDQLRILVESSPAGILTLNHRGQVLAANLAAHEMLGFTQPASLIGVNVADHVPVFAGALRVSPGSGTMRVSSASWAKRANGSHFPVAVWFSTYEEANQRRLAGILVDTSEEVREREHETFRYLTDSSRLLAGAVAHEIRNLCSAVRVVTSNLRRHPQVAEDADFNALNTLVDSLMRISAFELGNQTQQAAARVDVAAVLEELRVVIEQDWADIGGSIHVEADASLPQVHADEHALLQVFLNLSQNSLRAVQRGGEPRLEIHAVAEDGRATVTFEDAGPGIDDASKLFRPFRENSDGSGLGLYVSRAMLRGFGGELTHVPTERGCRFDVTLPTYAMAPRAGRS